MDGFCLQGELDLTLFYKIEGCRVTSLYEHHCYRKYCDILDESSEGFFWEEFYQTDSEQGSYTYYREHQEVQRERTPGDNHNKSVAQVVIRWVMQTGVLPLAKSVTPSRIKENFDVFDFELSQQEMFEIASLKADRIGSDPDTCDF